MSITRLTPRSEVPAPGTPDIVRQALDACAYEQRRLEVAIADVEARIEVARAARASLPSLGRLLTESHESLRTMERVYRNAAARALRDANAEADAVVSTDRGHPVSRLAFATRRRAEEEAELESWLAHARRAPVLRLVPDEPDVPAALPDPAPARPARHIRRAPSEQDRDAVRRDLIAQVNQAKHSLIALSERLTELLAVAEQEERAVWAASADPQRLALQASIDAWMDDRRRQLDAELHTARTVAMRRRYAAEQVWETTQAAGLVRGSFA